MNRDDIIRWAREAGWTDYSLTVPFQRKQLERFAFFVAAVKQEAMLRDGWRQCAVGQGTTQFCAMVEEAVSAERDACLAILRDMEAKKWHTVIHGGEMKGVSLHDAYMAIRARGNSETL